MSKFNNRPTGLTVNREGMPAYAMEDRARLVTQIIDILVHAIDLMGYGTQQFAGTRTNIIEGWSEKVFEFILMAEQGAGTLEETIACYE